MLRPIVDLASSFFVPAVNLDISNMGSVDRRRRARLKVCWWGTAILLGFLQAWATRHTMNEDGISYLDVGDAYFRRDWNMAINGYWSPLYSWLIGATLHVVRPSAYNESTIVHMVNFAIYLFALACFDFFLGTLIGYQERAKSPRRDRTALCQEAWLVLGFALFISSSLGLISLEVVTPDLCLSGFVYLAAAALIRIRGGDASWSTFGLLGGALGIGYLAKAPLFPLAFIFLGTGLFAVTGGLGGRRAVPRFLLGVLVFAIVSGPFIFALSRAKRRFTFGESGRLNYAEYVDGVAPFIHWQGGDKGTGSPKHPTRKISDFPPLYEFAAPVGGTYPPWYDQSYWYEGVKARFNLKGQLAVLGASAAHYAKIFLFHQASLILGFLALFLLGWRGLSFFSDFTKQWHVLIPALAALTLFALVHVDARFVASFIVLLWVGLFSGISIPDSQISGRLISSLITAMAIVLGVECAWGVVRDLRTAHHARHVQWEVAEGLRALGIRPGDKVATIGYGIGDYWARLARVSIVAEIPYEIHIISGATSSSSSEPVDSFWESGCDVESRAIEKFAQTGARAIIAGVHGDVPPTGWHTLVVGGQDCFCKIGSVESNIGRSSYVAYTLPGKLEACGNAAPAAFPR